MKIYQYPAEYNVGDTLSLPIFQHFFPGEEVTRVPETEEGKILAVGSIMTKVKFGDILFGTGVMREKDIIQHARNADFLAVRGKLTRERIIASGGRCPEIYGDPGLLLPLMYAPYIEKTHSLGIIPHYVDKDLDEVKKLKESTDSKIIDVALPWKQFVDQVLSCRNIISSSLHGLVIAEAYGIPAEWRVFSNKVIGNGFKFRDYLTGTGRSPQDPGKFPPIENLKDIQDELVETLEKNHKKIISLK